MRMPVLPGFRGCVRPFVGVAVGLLGWSAKRACRGAYGGWNGGWCVTLPFTGPMQALLWGFRSRNVGVLVVLGRRGNFLYFWNIL